MRPLRIASILVTLLLVAVIGGAGAVAWLVGTGAGARLVVDRLVEMTGAVLTAETVDGTLLGGLTFGGLRFDIERVEATAEQATATFDLPALLQGRVVIRDLFVSPVNVVPKAADPASADDSGPFEAVDLPVAIEFDSIVVAGVNLDVDETPYPFGQLTMTVSYIDRIVEVVRFETTWDGLSFSTQATFDLESGPVVDAALSLSGRLAEQDVLLGARVAGELPAVEVDAELLEPVPVNATGTVVLNAGPGFDLAIEWDAIDDDLLARAGLSMLAIGAGSGRVSGDPGDVAFIITSAAAVDGAGLAVSASGRATPAMVRFDDAELRRDDAVVNLTGAIDLTSLAFTGSVRGTRVDPAWLAPDWNGDLSIAADVTGRLGTGWQVQSDNVVVDGEIRGQPLMLAGSGAYSESGAVDLRDAELRIGSNTLTANGRLAGDVTLDVEAELADLGQLLEGLSGRASGAVAVSGALDDLLLDGQIALVDVAFANARVGTLDVSGQLGTRGDSPIALALTAGGVEVATVPAVNLSGSVTGTADAHIADVDVVGDDWQGTGRLEGRLAGLASWSGLVSVLRYTQPPFGQWTLGEPVALDVAPDRIALDTACLTQQAAELCLGLVYGANEDGRLRISATDFDLEVLQPLLPEGVTASGRYQIDIDVTGPRTSPLGTIDVIGGPTRLTYARTAEDVVTAELAAVSANARIELDRFESTAEVLGNGDDNVRFRLSGDRRADDDVAIDGRIDASWADVAPLTILSRHVGEVAGSVTAGIRIGGTLDEPQLDGQAELSDGQLGLPEWGVVADSIRGTARSTNGETIAFQATGQVDGSELRLSGEMQLTAAEGWPTRLELSGDRVPIVQIADADIVVSPALVIDVDLPRVDVAGTVDVPEALIAISELPEQAVRPSGDSVVHGAEAEERVSPLLLNADIELRLGDDVEYQGSGLLADLGGELRLRYSSQTSADAAGTLTVTGTYEAFGQELVLERGELIFTGPLQNPNLNIRAVRRVEDITVGIDLTGSLEAPVSRIFSEPAMAEADAVSYLLFGRPLAVPDGNSDPDQLRNAAVSLGLRQAVPVIQRIGDTLGFDEFGIESTEVDVGELMAGKYLSPKLYVRYSYGLFNRIGGLLLQYRLNERVSIETRSGDQKSMDILFTIERE